MVIRWGVEHPLVHVSGAGYMCLIAVGAVAVKVRLPRLLL